ncbi:MAG: nucleotidyltransferase family protein [Oscillospiraceae bacterium]|nr:nucleotidyltransferase family protein [Oscillospiraceae bacterium]
MSRPFSAVVLAGGYSSRMGRNKAELSIQGCSFLEHQVEKLRSGHLPAPRPAQRRSRRPSDSAA